MSTRARAIAFFSLAGVLACVVLLGIYWPALHGQFLWDDNAWTTDILKLLRDSDGLKAIWLQPTSLQQYYPLTATTFWLDYHFWKLWTLPYHLENVALHVVAVLLFWRLLRCLNVPGAWLAAGIFAMHPIMAESIAWITERKNVLSMVFFLGGLLAYGRFDSFCGTDDTRPRNWGAYIFAVVLLILALLAKTTTSCFPAVVLLLCWWKQGTIRWRKDVLPVLPLFALAIGFSSVTAWLEKNHVGAMGWEWSLSFPQRCMIAGHTFWFYIGQFIFPANLCFIYPHWQPDANSLVEWLWPATALAGLLGLWVFRKQMGRGPVTAVFFYIGTLFPVMGFMNAYGMRYSFVWDHWFYLPSLGLIALVAAALTKLAAQLNAVKAFHISSAILLALLGFLTWRQSAMYVDNETLWRTTIAKNPSAFLAYNNLGYILLERNDLDGAITLFNKSVEANPNFSEPHNNLGDALIRKGMTNEGMAQFQRAAELVSLDNHISAAAFYNLGDSWLATGHPAEAAEQFQKALAVYPDFAKARNNLGCAFLRMGQTNEAFACFQRAVEIDSELSDAQNNLADALVMQGRTAEAERHYKAALQARPDFPDALQNLARLLLVEGKSEEAISHFENALKEKETATLHNDLANLLLSQNRVDESLRHYEHALVLEPTNGESHYNFATILMVKNRLDEAAAHFQKAVELLPASAMAHYRLALVSQAQKKFGLAITEYEKSLKLDPTSATAVNNLAWMLATCPATELRNGTRAVALAKQTEQLAGGKHADALDTLAAAYAENGQFSEAVQTAREAIHLAEQQGNARLVTGLQTRLALYEAKTPWHEKP